MQQLGGNAIYLNTRDSQLGRGEPVEDAAQVISRMSDLVMENGDWVVVTTPATVTALPLGSILKLIHPGLAAQDVCRRAAEIAARTDPLDHHAVAAFAFHDDHVTLAAQRSLS